MEKIAIITLGATSLKMTLINVAPNGYYNIFDELVENVKLAGGVEKDGVIKALVINESLKILKLYRKICDSFKITKIIAVAENFVKTAKNQKSFFDEIYNNTGFNFTIYNQDESIKIVYTGVINSIDVSKGVIINIEPSISQIIQFNRRQVLNSFTINFGALNLAEIFEDETNPEVKCNKMVEFIKSELEGNPILSTLESETTFIGSGTTFLSMGRLARKATKYSLDLENNYIITEESANKVFDIVKTLDLDKTQKLKGISESRADTLASGTAILKAFMDIFAVSELSVSKGGFEEGVICNCIQSDFPEKLAPDMLAISLETIRTFYDRELANTENVYNLAVILFKQLKVIHKLPRGYIKPLRIAASMYDCGTRISFNNYENNAFDVILNSKINGATQKEILLAAFVARCQNLENLTLQDWLRYRDILTEEDLEAVRKLGVIVALANALDKSRSGNIVDISCDILGDSIIMKTIIKADASYDILQGQKVATDFKKVFKKQLQVI